MRTINHIVSHCTATLPTARVDVIVGYWANTLKWKYPGYHYLIEANGKIHQLLEESIPSNGVKGHNHDSIHISYVGGVDEHGKAVDTRTDAQKIAMLTLMLDLKTRYPNADIKGHRDFSVDKNHNGIIDPWERIKECPSYEVSEFIKPKVTKYN